MIEKYKRFLKTIILAGSILLIFFTISYVKNCIPDRITISEWDEQSFNLGIPLKGTLMLKDNDNTCRVDVDLNKDVSISAGNTGEYKFDFKLLGLFDFKSINVNVVEKKVLMPCGIPVGIYIKTDGVLVVGTGEVTDYLGCVSEPAAGKVKRGDYVVAVNGTAVNTKSELVKQINENDEDYIVFDVRRDNEILNLRINKVKDAKGIYKVGIWVRDDTQGIGTLTYIDEEGNFGALGHGISDIDTGLLLELSEGKIYDSNIYTIIKGKNGSPGEFVGRVMYGDDNYFGDITENTSMGIYGTVGENVFAQLNSEYVEIAFAQEICTGDAFIRCQINGEVKDYEISILSVDVNDDGNKGIVFKVTDDSLLSETNGIVQGMSGSPILQNNKIIGAVTHVFVNDSTKGYGILIENMVEH